MKLLRKPVRESSFFRPKNRNFLGRKVGKPTLCPNSRDNPRRKRIDLGLTCRRKLPMTYIDLYAQCVRPSEERGEEKSLVAFPGEHGRGKRMENRAATLLIFRDLYVTRRSSVKMVARQEQPIWDPDR
jgi:hypothetical protein